MGIYTWYKEESKNSEGNAVALKIDADVKKMTESELRREIMKLRTAFRKELADTGNRRCWINLLAALPEGESIKPLSLPRETFLKNCAGYYDRNK